MWSNPFQGKPQRWVFLSVPSLLSLGTAVESTRAPVQDSRMKPPLAFRAGYLGGPAAGWEPSKLGCMVEHLLGPGWTLEISLALTVSCGLGLMLRVRQHFLSCSVGLSSHSLCVGTSWISLKEITPHVAMYLVPLRELGSLFLSLMEVLYDYPVVYLMSVLALCPSLLRPSESWSCYATYCIRSPVGSNIVFSAFFFKPEVSTKSGPWTDLAYCCYLAYCWQFNSLAYCWQFRLTSLCWLTIFGSSIS